MSFILLPAYGRTYNSRKAILEDANNGKDFLLTEMCSSTYGNKEDIPDGTYQVRYGKNNTKVTTITFKNKKVK